MVDTEFMRENSYWPELCLIQIADDEEAAAIDPMAQGLDMKPLLDLLTENEDVLKVFHAGGQDIEIVYNLTGKTPHPLFDTQVAAMALGQGEQIGYSNLVDTYLGITVDKGARFTDWGPPPTRQAPDRLCHRRRDASFEDLPADAREAAQDRPRRLARRGDGAARRPRELPQRPRRGVAARPHLQPQGRSARSVEGARPAGASSRAQGKDLPRGRIIKDETLADLAANPPKKQVDLGRVRGLSTAWATNDIGGRMLAALADAVPMTAAELPPRDGRKPPLGKDGALVADLLKLLLKIRAKEINVASRLLARSEELEALAAGQREDLPMLQGWRYEQFGRDAVELVEGQLGFTVRGGKLKMTRTEEPS